MVGSNDLEVGGTFYEVEEGIAHEKFDIDIGTHDIGVYRLKKPIEFNSKVQPIKYSDEFVSGGVKLTLSGWGRLKVSLFCFDLIIASFWNDLNLIIE